ncbi:MAG: hypothetical protein WBF21_21140 [Steroidobacteraceae bacterium]
MLESELELEGLGEFEDEFESELEDESEDEYESELETEDEYEDELEDEYEGEYEDESEDEWESEGPNPVIKVYPDAMMEHLGAAAMEAETEDEAAEHFLPLVSLAASKLLPLAAKALPKVAGKALPKIARVVAHATPHMTRAVGHITRQLHRNPNTRHLLRAVPSVARRAVTTLARHAAAGHRVTPKHAVRILARENRRVMHNPKILRSVLKKSKKMDHKLGALGHRHHLHGAGMPRVGRAGYPVARGRGVRAVRYGRGGRGFSASCPTCGASRVRGVRRTCCCC